MPVAIRQPALLCSLALLATTTSPERPEKVASYRLLDLVARWASLRLVEGP
jgi:hypothetical protein